MAVATGLFLWTRRHAPAVRYLAALSVAVHASAVLALQQVLATPLHILRESLTSPFNLSAMLPLFDEGSLAARILGTVELFGLWWALLLALGAATLTGRRAREYAGPMLGTYLGIAAAVAGAVGLIGGSSVRHSGFATQFPGGSARLASLLVAHISSNMLTPRASRSGLPAPGLMPRLTVTGH